MPGERVLLSEDLTLLRSLGAVVTYLLENVRLQQRRQEQDLLERELRVQSSQSELKALRAQINPHFLFNALNTVASLIHSDSGTRRPRRGTAVRGLPPHLASLRERMGAARSGTGVRRCLPRRRGSPVGSRLRDSIDADAAARRALVPSMVVRTWSRTPRSTASRSARPGTLAVVARVAGDRLTVAVS